LKINNQTNTSYKTKPCHAFLKRGYCQFGYRCNFVHEEAQELEEDHLQQKMANFREVIQEARPNRESKLMRLLQD